MTQVREAYECLIDKAKRAAYDALYFDLQDQWASYWEWQETQRKDEERKRADEEQRAARERAELERKAVEAERARRMEEEKRVAREKVERERMREERARQAEERSKEAARRAREQQEQAAKERLRREKEREAEKRSEEAAWKVRIEQERAAQERLKSILIEEQQDAIRRNWTKMREAAKRREGEPVQRAPSGSPRCAHPRLGWPRKKGRANCVFCRDSCPKWGFYCPECNASACQSCKYNYCVY